MNYRAAILAGLFAASGYTAALAQGEAQCGEALNLENADVRSVVDEIAMRTGKKFVLDPRVAGQVTIKSGPNGGLCADEAWELFQGIESKGGLVAALTSAFIQDEIARVAETATARAGTPAPQHGVIQIISTSARVRSGPGTNFDQIGQVLAGEVYEVIAQAPSSTGTGETWFLIDLPNGSSGWVSSEPVDLQPDNVVPPFAVTVPPTPTVLAPTATPTQTATPTEIATSAPSVDSATDVIQVTITAAGVPYNFGFSSGRFTSLRVSATAYTGGTIRVVVRDSAGSVIIDQNNVGEFVIPLVPNSDYTLEVSDTSGGTGSFNMVLERSVAP